MGIDCEYHQSIDSTEIMKLTKTILALVTLQGVKCYGVHDHDHHDHDHHDHAQPAIARSPQRSMSMWPESISGKIGIEKGHQFVPYEVLIGKRSHWLQNAHLDHGIVMARGQDNGGHEVPANSP